MNQRTCCGKVVDSQETQVGPMDQWSDHVGRQGCVSIHITGGEIVSETQNLQSYSRSTLEMDQLGSEFVHLSKYILGVGKL